MPDPRKPQQKAGSPTVGITHVLKFRTHLRQARIDAFYAGDRDAVLLLDNILLDYDRAFTLTPLNSKEP